MQCSFMAQGIELVRKSRDSAGYVTYMKSAWNLSVSEILNIYGVRRDKKMLWIV